MKKEYIAPEASVLIFIPNVRVANDDTDNKWGIDDGVSFTEPWFQEN